MWLLDSNLHPVESSSDRIITPWYVYLANQKTSGHCMWYYTLQHTKVSNVNHVISEMPMPHLTSMKIEKKVQWKPFVAKSCFVHMSLDRKGQSQQRKYEMHTNKTKYQKLSRSETRIKCTVLQTELDRVFPYWKIIVQHTSNRGTYCF